jgi:siroheme synthase
MTRQRSAPSLTTPALPVSAGSRAWRQNVIEATLADVVERTAERKPGETGLPIIGEVVRPRAQLDWFRPA